MLDAPSRRRWRHADCVADLHARESPQLGDLPGDDGRTTDRRAGVKDANRSDLLVVLPYPQAVADLERAREHPYVADLLADRAAVHLEDRAGQRAVDVSPVRRQQPGDPRPERVRSGAGDRRSEVDRVDPPLCGLGGELVQEPAVGDRRLVLDVRREKRVVALGEQVDQPRREVGVVRAVRREGRAARPEPADSAHGDDRRSQPFSDAPEHVVVLCTAAVDLVDEDDRGNPQALQRAHQHAGLRLHALHSRHDEHCAVEHAEYPLHFGDEVRVAGRVEEVDRHVVDHERHDRGSNGDAALALQCQRVGLGASGVDAADLVENAGVEQQPLGQARLSGVNMRHDPEVQSLQASCPHDG